MALKTVSLFAALVFLPLLARAETGTLVLTGGVSGITGAAGGGITRGP